MYYVEKTEAIGIQYNLTLFTAQKVLCALFANPSMKLTGRVSSIAMFVWWQVIETVGESIF